MYYEKIIIRPVSTEKSDRMKELNCYQFIVAKKATKQTIKKAIENLFNVDVINVRTANYCGKLRRFGRSRGYTPGYKKAWVWIKEGQRIEVIEGV